MPTYPRTTVAAVIAGLAGGLASALITTLVVTTLTATTATIATGTINTATIGALTATSSLVAYNGTIGALNASSTLITPSLSASSTVLGTGGTAITGRYRATLAVDPQSIAAGGSTTTVVTVTGAATGDHCEVATTAGDLWSTTSTAILSCRAGTNNATVNYYNATSTAAFDAGASTLTVQVWK